jgi:hypothetical protein
MVNTLITYLSRDTAQDAGPAHQAAEAATASMPAPAPAAAAAATATQASAVGHSSTSSSSSADAATASQEPGPSPYGGYGSNGGAVGRYKAAAMAAGVPHGYLPPLQPLPPPFTVAGAAAGGGEGGGLAQVGRSRGRGTGDVGSRFWHTCRERAA